MDIFEVLTDDAPEPVGPYSQAAIVGGMIFCSGQIAIDPATGTLVDGDIGAETTQVLKNLQAVLTAAGSALEKVVKTTIYLRDMNDFGTVNEVYAACFSEVKPARATVQVAALPKGAGVEIDCIAVM